jgi:hypothetical protein
MAQTLAAVVSVFKVGTANDGLEEEGLPDLNTSFPNEGLTIPIEMVRQLEPEPVDPGITSLHGKSESQFP